MDNHSIEAQIPDSPGSAGKLLNDHFHGLPLKGRYFCAVFLYIAHGPIGASLDARWKLKFLPRVSELYGSQRAIVMYIQNE